jgi:hypothetical protein
VFSGRPFLFLGDPAQAGVGRDGLRRYTVQILADTAFTAAEIRRVLEIVRGIHRPHATPDEAATAATQE